MAAVISEVAPISVPVIRVASLTAVVAKIPSITAIIVRATVGFAIVIPKRDADAWTTVFAGRLNEHAIGARQADSP